VGVDTRTGVEDHDYRVPFRFTGELNKLTFKLEQPDLSAGDQKILEEAKKRVAAAIQ
jgi:arylsulfatase